MDFRRAAIAGVAGYLTTFILGMVIVVALGLEPPDDPNNVPPVFWITNLVIAVSLTAGLSYWYFLKAPGGAKEGLYLGLVFMLVGFVVDIILWIPVVMQDGTGQIIAYYASPIFWVFLALIIATAVVMGWRAPGKSAAPPKRSSKRP